MGVLDLVLGLERMGAVAVADEANLGPVAGLTLVIADPVRHQARLSRFVVVNGMMAVVLVGQATEELSDSQHWQGFFLPSL
jgi:hypothetical protein